MPNCTKSDKMRPTALRTQPRSTAHNRIMVAISLYRSYASFANRRRSGTLPPFSRLCPANRGVATLNTLCISLNTSKMHITKTMWRGSDIGSRDRAEYAPMKYTSFSPIPSLQNASQSHTTVATRHCIFFSPLALDWGFLSDHDTHTHIEREIAAHHFVCFVFFFCTYITHHTSHAHIILVHGYNDFSGFLPPEKNGGRERGEGGNLSLSLTRRVSS